MRLTVITQYYVPEPSRTPTSITRGLAARGHRVRVVTGFPNYPTGRLYDGYRQSLTHVERDDAGLQVRRVPLVTSHSSNGLTRALNYLSFMVSGLLATRFARGSDVTYVYASQPTGALAALVWRIARGTPYVIHVQDLWPDSITASGMLPSRMSKVVGAVINRALRPLYSFAAAVVVISPYMRDALIARGIDPGKLHVVFNWSPDETPCASRAPSDAAGCTVTYAGNLGSAQGLDTAVQAARIVADELPGFRLLFVGSGTMESELRRLADGLECVEFRGRVPADKMPEIYAETSFQLVILRPTGDLAGAVPSKLQASLSAGMPVICSAPGSAPEIVRSAAAGFTASPGNVEELAEAYRRAYACSSSDHAAYARNARAYYTEHLSSTVGLAKLEALLSSAIKSTARRAHSPQEA
ncbi:glycosyltransferase family 4 protein [Cellulomonas flavigena]|nr:glycosyltransferase family 4 protein [Cellulomonas flavigena]